LNTDREVSVTKQEHKRYSAVIALLADASNRMHASYDITAIMQAGRDAAIDLVGVSAGAVALMIDQRLAFSEYRTAGISTPLDKRFGDDTAWVGDLLNNRTAFILTEPADLAQFSEDTSHCFPVTGEIAIVPVNGEQRDILACLLLFSTPDHSLHNNDLLLLEQLASMMAVAVENSIEHSEKRRIEADLEKSVATYRTLVEQIPAITYIATLDRSRILFVSPQVEDILGYQQDDFLANQEIWAQQIHPDDRERVLADVRTSLQEKLPFHCEYRICSKDGRDIWVKDAAATVRDQDQDLYLQGVVYDISERKASEQRLMVMAHYDQLTGLANRALFHDRLTQVLAQAKRHSKQFAVLYIDLDGFKAVNDNLGHQAGDQLLVEVASRLKSSVREVDTVARMGGDEFTILLDDIHTRASIEQVADKLVTAVAAPYPHLNTDLPVTMSMGIALFPKDSNSADILITNADNAMYRAKESGKNRYCFH